MQQMRGTLQRLRVSASLVSKSSNTASSCARLRAQLALVTAWTSASIFSSSRTVSRCPPWAARVRLVEPICAQILRVGVESRHAHTSDARLKTHTHASAAGWRGHSLMVCQPPSPTARLPSPSFLGQQERRQTMLQAPLHAITVHRAPTPPLKRKSRAPAAHPTHLLPTRAAPPAPPAPPSRPARPSKPSRPAPPPTTPPARPAPPPPPAPPSPTPAAARSPATQATPSPPQGPTARCAAPPVWPARTSPRAPATPRSTTPAPPARPAPTPPPPPPPAPPARRANTPTPPHLHFHRHLHLHHRLRRLQQLPQRHLPGRCRWGIIFITMAGCGGGPGE